MTIDGKEVVSITLNGQKVINITDSSGNSLFNSETKGYKLTLSYSSGDGTGHLKGTITYKDETTEEFSFGAYDYGDKEYENVVKVKGTYNTGLTNSGSTIISTGTYTGTFPTIVDYDDKSFDITLTADTTIDVNVGVCFVKGTLITLADGTKKACEDITYDDDLLVWDFNKGELSHAKPVWISKMRTTTWYSKIYFNDGNVLKLVGPKNRTHHLYNATKRKFMFPQSFENGDKVFKEDGTLNEIIKCEDIEEEVEYYNIITDKYYDCFINGVLSSSKMSNEFKINENMQYDKSSRVLKEEYPYWFIHEKLLHYTLPRPNKYKLSIIIPNDTRDVYYINRALEKIDNQNNVDFKDLEVVIIGLKEHMPTYMPQNFTPKEIYTTTLRTPGKARDIGLAQAEGKWVFFHDSDDVLTDDDSLNSMMNIVNKNSDKSLIVWNWYWKNTITDEIELKDGRNEFNGLFSICVRRDELEKLDLRFADLEHSEDRLYVTVLKLKLKDKTSYSDITPYTYFRNQKGITSNYFEEENSETVRKECVDEYNKVKYKSYKYYLHYMKNNSEYLNWCKNYGIDLK